MCPTPPSCLAQRAQQRPAWRLQPPLHQYLANALCFLVSSYCTHTTI